MDSKEMYFNFGLKNARKFKHLADEVVELIVVDDIDDESRTAMSFITATNMALGAKVKRNEHILTGIGIGILGTGLAWGVTSFVKRKKKSYKFSKEELEGMGIKTFNPETIKFD